MGLKTESDDTIRVDVPALTLALEPQPDAVSELDTGTAESFKRAFEKLLLETTTRNLIAIA